MPTLTVPASVHQPARYDLLPGDETADHEGDIFVPHLPRAHVGDLILLGDYTRVYRIVAEDERGHSIVFDHRRPEPEWIA